MKEETYLRRLLTIGAVMFRIGCLTFGGGWSIVAQMEEEFTAKRGYMTTEQLTDDVALGKSLPGIMIINTAVIFGYQAAGIAGAFVASIALSMPALIAITIVAFFYNSLRANVFVARILSGVRCAVVPIIMTAGFRLKKNSLISRCAYILAALSFAVCAFSGTAKFLVVAGGGAAGFLLFRKAPADTGKTGAGVEDDFI